VGFSFLIELSDLEGSEQLHAPHMALVHY